MKVLRTLRHRGKTTLLRDVSTFTLRDKLLSLAIDGGCGAPDELIRTHLDFANCPLISPDQYRFVVKVNGVLETASVDFKDVLSFFTSFAKYSGPNGTNVSVSPMTVQKACSNGDYWGKADLLKPSIYNMKLALSLHPTIIDLYQVNADGYDFVVSARSDPTMGIIFDAVFVSGDVLRSGNLRWQATPSRAFEGFSRAATEFVNWNITEDTSSPVRCLYNSTRDDFMKSLDPLIHTGPVLGLAWMNPEPFSVSDFTPLTGGFYTLNGYPEVKALTAAQVDFLTSQATAGTVRGQLEVLKDFPPMYVTAGEMSKTGQMLWLDKRNKRVDTLTPRQLYMCSWGRTFVDSLKSLVYGGTDGSLAKGGVNTDLLALAEASNYCDNIFTLAEGEGNPLEGQDLDAITSGGVAFTTSNNQEDGYIGNAIWCESRSYDERSVALPLVQRDQDIVQVFSEDFLTFINIDKATHRVRSYVNDPALWIAQPYSPPGGSMDTTNVLRPK